ncbi:hypothetical protein A1351_22605 [Methylosinus sp. R-45379]|uniref:LuxR C-terminal-related transcriptional regulator n=1 Tax=Methylosinus sp. R-45379 TaxID=980563 RepID=UPI0007C8B320|nr:LuxR C-terminal-related transcriptional regulator [Methylosinus sp. R-45379]OAI30582.1 hypothetical protein A1351_22605 [Methylosinus sp. R-45379]
MTNDLRNSLPPREAQILAAHHAGATRIETGRQLGLSPETVKIYLRRARARRASAPRKLTPREHEILALLSQGLSSKQIAAQIGSRFRTVDAHLGNIYLALGVHTRTAATVAYLRMRATEADAS